MRYYTSRAGDSLPRLSVLFYFRHDLYYFLYLSNKAAIGEDIFVLPTNTKLAIPEPLMEEISHTALEGETSVSIAEKYYGFREFYNHIDQANDWPPTIVPGAVYRVPALLSRLKFDAAAEVRRKLNVEFDR